MAEFDDAAIEKVARDLCIRDGKGPDCLVQPVSAYIVRTPIGDRHLQLDSHHAYPLWHCWRGMAVEVLRVARDLVPQAENSP